jgi:hypothetical protein
MKSAFIISLLSISIFTQAGSAKIIRSHEWTFYSHGEKILVYQEQLATQQRNHVVTFGGVKIHKESVSIEAPYVEGFYRSSDYKDVPEEISYLVLNSYAGDGCPSKFTVIKFTATKRDIFEDIGNCDPIEKIELSAKGLQLTFKKNRVISEGKAQSRVF